MELDDLKEKWKTASFQSSFDMKDVLEKRINALERSGRGLRTAFYFEMAIAALAFGFFIVLVVFMREKMMSYMYKIMVVTIGAMIPVVWRLYKSQRWINSMDYSKDMRSNMEAFLEYYKFSIRLYRWMTYVIIVAAMLVTFTDSSFIGLSTRVKVMFLIYLATVAIVTEPYLRIVYGRRIATFENFLKD